MDYHKILKCDRGNILSEDSWMSKSVIWEYHNSSLWKWRHHPKVYIPTDSMKWGSLIDCLTTTPELFGEMYHVRPETYPAPESKKKDALMINKPWSGNATYCKDWIKNHSDKEIITKEMLHEAEIAAHILLEVHDESSEIFAKSNTQVIIGGKIAGVKCKGLIDLEPQGTNFLADLKTTADFSEDGFAKTIANYGYNVQGGKYLALWNAMHPEDQRDSFKIIWQNSAAPYEVAVTEISKQDLDDGYDYAVHLIKTLKEATEKNHWPMLMEGENKIISRPAWASINQGIRMSSPPLLIQQEPSDEGGMIC